jgi:hypothetical protein
MNQNCLGILKMVRDIFLCTNNLTPRKRVGEVFVVKLFSQVDEGKLNQDVSQYGQYHKLGDVICLKCIHNF